MLGYLNSFRVPGDPWLDRFIALGLTGIRTDIEPEIHEASVDALGKHEALSPLFLFGGGNISGWDRDLFESMTCAVAKKIKREGYFKNVPIYFEIGNEPDIAIEQWREDPEALADTYWECYRLVKSIHNKIEVITGGISNLNERGLDYLEDFMVAKVPNNTIVGFHRYPNGPDMNNPHDGFASRESEMNRLQVLSEGHRLFCTETGFSEGPYKVSRRFPLCFLHRNVWVEKSVQAETFRREWNFYHRRNVIGMVWYQKVDGPNKNNILDHYGIYKATGAEKPICTTMRDVLLT